MVYKRQLVNVSCKDYCDAHNYKYTLIKNEQNQKVFIPNYWGKNDNKNYEELNYPEIYVAELLNTKIIGNTSIVYDEQNNCIYDLPLMENAYRYDLTHISIDHVDKNFTNISYEESNEVIQEGIMLVGMAPYNYFHFNFESLSKLCLINTINKYKNIPILVDEAILTIPQFAEELSLLNDGEREIRFIKKGYSYNVKKLIYISDLMIMGFNIKSGYRFEYKDIVLNEYAVNLIHDKIAINNTISKRFYISRKNSLFTRLENADQIERIFNEYGYEIIFPEKMSFMEQVLLFSRAEFIAGPSGAGLTNMLFANKNATMICIIPKEIELSCFSNITGILGQKNYYLDAKLSYDHYLYYQSRYTVDVDNIRLFLERIHPNRG